MIVGLAGLAGVGKTTVARAIHDVYGHTIVSYATPIKQALVALTGLPMAMFTNQDMKNTPLRVVDGKTPRELMQLFGTEFCVNIVSPNLLINLMSRRIGYGGNYVIDDVRVQAEADLVTSLGGVVATIYRDGVNRTSDHSTEAGVKCDHGLWLPNDKSQLKETVRQWSIFK